MTSEVKTNTISESSSGSGVTIDGVKLKDSGIESSSGSRVLASDSGSAWSWGSGIPSGSVLQVVTNTDNTEVAQATGDTPWNYSQINTAITLKKANSKILVQFNFGAVVSQDTSNIGYAKIMYKIGSGSYSDVTPIGLNTVNGSSKHHMAVNLTQSNYQVDAGSSMVAVQTTSSAKDTVLTFAPYFWAEGSGGDIFINRSFRDGSEDFSTLSSCTLIEIAT